MPQVIVSHASATSDRREPWCSGRETTWLSATEFTSRSGTDSVVVNAWDGSPGLSFSSVCATISRDAVSTSTDMWRWISSRLKVASSCTRWATGSSGPRASATASDTSSGK